MISGYLQGLVKVLGIGAGFATIPLIAALAGLEPPWPPAIGYVCAGLILIAALISWEWTRRSKLRVRRLFIVIAAVLTLVGLTGYLIEYSIFVEPVPGTKVRVVRGFECTPDAAQVYGTQCPDLPREALRNAEWESLALWTRSSVTAARMGLVAAWLTFVLGLITAVGSVIAGRKV